MIAAVFHGVKDGLRVEERPAPAVTKPDEVLIEVRACGVCGTDPAILEGRHPASPLVILGHEYGGVVTDVGKEVSSVKAGDHVVVDPNIKCGQCRFCRSGKQNLCASMTTLGIFLDGGFAQYNIAPQSAIYKIPVDMDWRDVALVEPVSCVINGVKRSGIGLGKSVAIIGAGPIGLIWVALAKGAGAAKVIVCETMAARQDAAKKLGADMVLDPRSIDVVKEVKAETDGGVDVAVEVVGSTQTVQQAIEMLDFGGRAVMFGTCPEDAHVKITPYDLMRHEKEIVGSFIANYTFRPAIEAMYRRQVPSDVLFTHHFTVQEIHRAIEVHRAGKSIKVLITP